MNRFANIYELLGDENDESPKSGQTAQAKVEPTKKVAPGPNKQQAKPAAKGAQASDQKGRAPQQQRSDRPDRRPREFSAPVGGEEVEKRRDTKRDQRDRDPERRQRAADAFPSRGNQRPFDRRSGTGRGRENKRSGGGKGNWGTVNDDQKAQTEKGAETQEGTEVPVGNKEATEQPASQEAPVEAVPEEEDNTKTLTEFLSQVKKPVVALPEARKANEGGSDKQWAKFKPLTRQFEEDSFFKGEDKEEQKKESAAESKEEGKKTVRADEVLKFTDGSPKREFSGRGGKRGGRGGDRGGRGGRGADRGGRGGSRGGKTGGAAPNYKDESAFPSLSPAPVKA
jgi:plasminogen activator inhibitor 1 RNA-binding protein